MEFQATCRYYEITFDFFLISLFRLLFLEISIVQLLEISRVQSLETSTICTLEISRRCTIEISRGVSSFLKLGGQVVMWHAAATAGALLNCQKLGGQLPTLPIHQLRPCHLKTFQ